jgi:hypothetical protein
MLKLDPPGADGWVRVLGFSVLPVIAGLMFLRGTTHG